MMEGAPLLCAGITVYSPLKYCKVTKGTRVGVVGLGGLGHIAVRLAHAMGAYVCVLSRAKSDDKKKLAIELGADEFITTEVNGVASSIVTDTQLDVIIDTVSADHDIERFINLLKFDGTYIVVGVPPSPMKIRSLPLCLKRVKIMGSAIGSVEETQEMLNFCAEKNVVCMTECIKMNQINEAFDRVVNADVKFRFVLDIKASDLDK